MANDEIAKAKIEATAMMCKSFYTDFMPILTMWQTITKTDIQLKTGKTFSGLGLTIKYCRKMQGNNRLSWHIRYPQTLGFNPVFKTRKKRKYIFPLFLLVGADGLEPTTDPL